MAKKSAGFQSRILASTHKYLRKLGRQESKLKKQLLQKDSLAAERLFGNVQQRYKDMLGSLHDSGLAIRPQYSGYLDSLTTSINFLKQSGLLNQSPNFLGKLNQLDEHYKDAQAVIDRANFIQQEIKKRQALLKEKLQEFGLGKQFRKYQQQAYYYKAAIKEYKDIFRQPAKLEATVLQVVNKIPSFRAFFNKHSELAALFRLPGNDGPGIPGLQGLQSRDMVMQELQARLGGGPNVQGYMTQSIRDAQQHLDKVKNKLNRLGGGGGDADMPDFRPNNEKTKSFLKRIELGTNIQSTKGTSLLPVSTDLGLSVGYKLNPKSIVGIGASYKLGWGEGIRHIALSGEGMGLRSFVDYRLKGSFYVSGGMEYNYMKAFRSIREVYKMDEWTRSALIGLSKMVSLKGKISKKAKLQLLWDMLSYRQVPRTQPIVFRVDYTLK